MAKEVFKRVEITLQDGTDVVLKPLVIGRLIRFMAAWEKIGDLPEGDNGFGVFVNCAGIALEENYKGKFDSLKANKDEAEAGEVLSAEYKEYLMDTIDLETIYLVLDVAGGIKLNDPKLLEAMAAELGQEFDLADLEAEALLLGIWKNVDDLEASLNIDELNAILKKSREMEHNNRKFLAAMKGINLDEDSAEPEETGEEALERIKRRAAARTAGLGEEIDKAVELQELLAMGIEIE